jgi:uncharacterized protein (TIGR02001 family)
MLAALLTCGRILLLSSVAGGGDKPSKPSNHNVTPTGVCHINHSEGVMKQVKTMSAALAVTGLLAAAGAAQAGVTSTATAVTDYDFRGTSQTARDAAIQVSVDYAHDIGVYVGAWGSNVDFGDEDIFGQDGATVEIDGYVGYSKTFDSGFSYDVGGTYYSYNHHDLDYHEFYAGVGYKWIKLKVWHSPNYGGQFVSDVIATANLLFGANIEDKTSAQYGELNATVPLPFVEGLSATAHVGLATGDYWDNVAGDDQIDYAVGLAYTLGKFNLGLKYIDTESDLETLGELFYNQGKVVFSVATTFPW